MEAVNQDLDSLQIVEVVLNGNVYGVNILKVKEILERQRYLEVPNSGSNVRGIFNYRGDIIPVINLHKSLGMESEVEPKNTIVLYYNSKMIAFEVDSIVGTSTYGWDLVSGVDGALKMNSNNSFTGIINDGEKLVIMIDFETIMERIEGTTLDNSAEIVPSSNEENKDINIVFSEDSGMMAKVIRDGLNQAGYKNITSFLDGKATLEFINNTEQEVDLFILDIEMPYVNGFTLTKEIKESNRFKDTPVILFSSLINNESKSRGESVGADYQISKPDIKELLQVINKAIK